MGVVMADSNDSNDLEAARPDHLPGVPGLAVSQHDVWLEYTIDDDGIWAFCPERINGCPFRKNLGHTPRCADVMNAVREHVADITGLP